MRNIAFTLAASVALLVGSSIDGPAEAAPITGFSAQTAKPQSPIPVEPVACGRRGPNCRAGFTWVCGPLGRCACVRC